MSYRSIGLNKPIDWTDCFTNIPFVRKEFLTEVRIDRSDNPAVLPYTTTMTLRPGDATGFVMHGGIPDDASGGCLHGFYEYAGSGIRNIRDRQRSGVSGAPSVGVHPAPLGEVLKTKNMGNDDGGDDDERNDCKKIPPVVHGIQDTMIFIKFELTNYYFTWTTPVAHGLK